MDGMRSLSYSMVFEVLATLSGGPMTLTQISRACKLKQTYLSAVISSAMASGLIEQKSGAFQLTRKGARTAIYILIVNDGMNYRSDDYRALMRALDRALESDAPV